MEYDPSIKAWNVGNTLMNFRKVDILSGGPLAAAPKPEKGTEEEPELEEPMDMDMDMEEPSDEEELDIEEPETEEEPEEEETPEEEPTIVSKAASGLGADIDRLAQLNAKKDELIKKWKAGELTTDEYKQQIGTIPQEIKALQAKIDRYSE